MPSSRPQRMESKWQGLELDSPGGVQSACSPFPCHISVVLSSAVAFLELQMHMPMPAISPEKQRTGSVLPPYLPDALRKGATSAFPTDRAESALPMRIQQETEVRTMTVLQNGKLKLRGFPRVTLQANGKPEDRAQVSYESPV